VPAATRQGIVVAYTPGFLNETVADYAFALLLALARRVHEGHLTMRGGQWQSAWGHDVHGKTLGILGCGRIGQAMARRATGFNMRLIGYDPAPSPEAKKIGLKFVSLDQLLAESDFLSLHAALTPDNRGLIGEAQLRKMKRDAYLINTARGALVDETALVRALQEGWIAGAALDAYHLGRRGAGPRGVPDDNAFSHCGDDTRTSHSHRTGDRRCYAVGAISAPSPALAY